MFIYIIYIFISVSFYYSILSFFVCLNERNKLSLTWGLACSTQLAFSLLLRRQAALRFLTGSLAQEVHWLLRNNRLCSLSLLLSRRFGTSLCTGITYISLRESSSWSCIFAQTVRRQLFAVSVLPALNDCARLVITQPWVRFQQLWGRSNLHPQIGPSHLGLQLPKVPNFIASAVAY